MALRSAISRSRPINKSPETSSKLKRDNSRNLSTVFARIFDKDTVDLYSKKLDDEVKRMSEIKNELAENGKGILNTVDAFNNKSEQLGIRAEFSVILKELQELAVKDNRLQAGLRVSASNLVKAVTERESTLKKKVVMVVMSLDDKIDKLKKELELATAENRSPTKLTSEQRKQPSGQINEQQTVKTLQKIIDHKEAEIKKLKSAIWVKKNFFKIDCLNLLTQRQNLAKAVELMVENASKIQRSLQQNQSDKLQLDLVKEISQPKFENAYSLIKDNDQGSRMLKSPFLYPSIKSLSIYGSLDKETISLRTERTSARAPKDLRVIVDRKFSEMSEKLELSKQNEAKISHAQSVIAELDSELSVYLNNHPDKNHKTWKSMISLKEGQIQLKRNSIEDLQKQNRLLRKDVEILKKEMQRMLTINQQKLKALAFNIRRNIDLLREQYRGTRKVIQDLQRKYQSNHSRRTIGLRCQFKELCAVNSTIVKKRMENFAVDNPQTNASNRFNVPAVDNRSLTKIISQNIKPISAKTEVYESPDYSKRSFGSVKRKELESLTLHKGKIDKNEQQFELFRTKVSNLIERDISESKLEAELVSSLFIIKQKWRGFAESIELIKTNVDSLRQGIENVNIQFSNEIQMRIKPYLLNSSLEDLESAESVLDLGQKLVEMIRQMATKEIEICEKISRMEMEIACLGDFKGIKERLEAVSKERKEGLKSLFEACKFTIPSLDNFNQKNRISNQMNGFLSEKLELKDKKISELLKRIADLEKASGTGHRTASRSANSVISKTTAERNKSKNPPFTKPKVDSKTTETKPKRSLVSGSQIVVPREQFISDNFQPKVDKPEKKVDVNYEEQIEYLLSVIGSYEKAFDAFKKEQDLEAEHRRARYRLKSEELEMAFSKMELIPDANFLQQYAANSSDNLNSFKEISINLQANISSLKIIGLKVSRETETVETSPQPNFMNVTSDKLIIHHQRFKRASEDFSIKKPLFQSLDLHSSGLTRPASSERPASLKELYSWLVGKQNGLSQFSPDTLRAIISYLSFMGSACENRTKTALVSIDCKISGMKSSISKVKNSLSKIRERMRILIGEKESYKKIGDSFKSHTLAVRLKEQSQKNTELSDFIFKVAQALTQLIPQVNIDDLTPEVILARLEDGLSGFRQANSKLIDLQMRTEELQKKNAQLITELEDKAQENSEMCSALESEILRTDRFVKHHEQDRQTLRKQLLQLTHEKVELEEKNDYFSRKVEALQTDLSDYKKNLSSLYETLYQYQSAGHRDFSFAESLKQRDKNELSTSKLSPCEGDDLSFDDIGTRFMRKEVNSDFLNEGSSEKFIHQYDDAKIEKISPGTNHIAFKKTDSVLEELYEEDKRTEEKSKLKETPINDSSCKNSDFGIPAENNTSQLRTHGEAQNHFERLIERKLIDFDLNSEQSIKDVPIIQPEVVINIREESEELKALFQPKYLKDADLDSYREVETEMPDPTSKEAVQLVSFKQFK